MGRNETMMLIFLNISLLIGSKRHKKGVFVLQRSEYASITFLEIALHVHTTPAVPVVHGSQEACKCTA